MAARKGAPNDTAPSTEDGRSWRRKTIGSISAPAKNVRSMLPKPATKSIQALVRSAMRLPASMPTMISTSAAGILRRMARKPLAAASDIQIPAISHIKSSRQKEFEQEPLAVRQLPGAPSRALFVGYEIRATSFQARSTSATDQACAIAPFGRKGGVASASSEIEP